MRNNFEFTFTQIQKEDYCLSHHQNKTGYTSFGKRAKIILRSFNSNCSKSSYLTFTLIQINEQGVIMVYPIYLFQNNAKIQKSSDYATLINI